MKILVKFPTRERPEKFFYALDRMNLLASQKDIHYFITLDENDPSMNNDVIKKRLIEYPNLTYIYGTSLNKINAVNRDMHLINFNWDVLILMSDDMICQKPLWDEILREEMRINFPDTNGVLYHWDGDQATAKHDNGKGLNTMCILGRKYFERFGYIYHPEYKSLWCDNEFSDVSRILNKEYKSMDVLFKHEHFSNNGTQPDGLMKRTQSFFDSDKQVYYKRKSINFGL